MAAPPTGNSMEIRLRLEPSLLSDWKSEIFSLDAMEITSHQSSTRLLLFLLHSFVCEIPCQLQDLS